MIFITGFAAAGASILFGLPFLPLRGGFMDVFGVALLVHFVHCIPCWRWREDPPSERAAPARRAA
jgi:hypothetical protein